MKRRVRFARTILSGAPIATPVTKAFPKLSDAFRSIGNRAAGIVSTRIFLKVSFSFAP
ncbi:hypothetical protein RI103_08995 [Paraburkholderia sp. FT54]|uniref:hypothetical protein n=1 Tax=Paraburkholderia sp. FT54 TaxID=3074437 RepID=UPI002877C589|nr:hypothetical protein [Paraburkholderia sp. FT54]WNC91461.1 hypothetical protein RI103_08995 [Paraburkholderia sp. FT54]